MITMSQYDIRIQYRTGNSYKTEEEETDLDLPMSDEEASHNLDRIEAHDVVVRALDSYMLTPTKRQEILDSLPLYMGIFTFCGMTTITLSLLVQGEEREVSVFWQGYFETLLGGTIIKMDY